MGSAGFRAAVVGGLAVSARTEPRFTRYNDLAVAVTADSDSERLLLALQARGWRITRLLEQDAAGRLASVRLTSEEASTSGVVVDLLLASSGIEPEVVDSAERLEVVPGLAVPVASIGDLVAMKLLSRDDETRPQDVADLAALRIAASAADRALARERVRAIVARGFSRGRDLEAALDGWLQRESHL